MNINYTHGKIDCTDCYQLEDCCSNGWELHKNPGYYGSSNPKVLVLGFSKGSTQMQENNFDDMAFKGMRNRLKELLVLLDFLDETIEINTLFNKDEKRFGFASLIRCGISKDGKTSGTLINKSFKDAKSIIETCSSKFLKESMPESVENIILLGSSKIYKKLVMEHFKNLFGDNFVKKDNDNFYTNNIHWQFVAHPSPANGWFNKWVDDYKKAQV